MLEAGREEKRLGKESDDYHQGLLAITIIVDGVWSKRSHKINTRMMQNQV